MSTRKQLILSLAIVALALGGVALYSLLAAPVEAGGADGHAGHGAAPAGNGALTPVTLDAEAARRIGVTYATAAQKRLTHEVRAVGSVTFDETRLADVNPKIEGWVERLHVDFTGAPVRRGQPLLEVYSPMLVSAQEELILARRLVDEAAAGGSERAARTARDLLESARRRLLYWDIAESEVAEIERTGTPRKTLTLSAPASGIVVAKNVVEGGRIMPGMDLYRIADLSRVWIEVEVFEKDLSLVELGQHGVVILEAYPGEYFDGLVTYVYPTVAVDARTGRVRLEMANPRLRIMPGMYATVLLHLAAPREGVVVPRTAVLQTGERSLVFVRASDGALVPREVTTGLAVGNDIEVVVGLEVGDVVVSSANFLIDAESNLGASVGAMVNGNGAAPADDHSEHIAAGSGAAPDATHDGH
jgi:membrane fusion protein, copper/silver efflux system